MSWQEKESGNEDALLPCASRTPACIGWMDECPGPARDGPLEAACGNDHCPRCASEKLALGAVSYTAGHGVCGFGLDPGPLFRSRFWQGAGRERDGQTYPCRRPTGLRTTRQKI